MLFAHDSTAFSQCSNAWRVFPIWCINTLCLIYLMVLVEKKCTYLLMCIYRQNGRMLCEDRQKRPNIKGTCPSPQREHIKHTLLRRKGHQSRNQTTNHILHISSCWNTSSKAMPAGLLWVTTRMTGNICPIHAVRHGSYLLPQYTRCSACTKL